MDHAAPALEALLTSIIDYAGLYPPAARPLPEVVERYEAYRASRDGWILNRLVLPAAKLPWANSKRDWRVALLVDDEPGPLPPEVETLETKAARRLSLPTYCEAPLAGIDGAFAKIRTGGLTPDAVPDSAAVATFLAEAAKRKIPFKATAGLHHAVRARYSLTYAPDSPRAAMHGFLNVFSAAVFAWYGEEHARLVEMLEETDARAFDFRGEELRWRERRVTAGQIRAARMAFAHSFGSCSFEEPVTELRNLGLLK